MSIHLAHVGEIIAWERPSEACLIPRDITNTACIKLNLWWCIVKRKHNILWLQIQLEVLPACTYMHTTPTPDGTRLRTGLGVEWWPVKSWNYEQASIPHNKMVPFITPFPRQPRQLLLITTGQVGLIDNVADL